MTAETNAAELADWHAKAACELRKAAGTTATDNPEPVRSQLTRRADFHDSAAALLRAGAAKVPDLAEGWRLVAVNQGFDDLMYWLGRCEDKGHLENCSDLIEPWSSFQYKDAPPAAQVQPGEFDRSVALLDEHGFCVGIPLDARIQALLDIPPGPPIATPPAPDAGVVEPAK